MTTLKVDLPDSIAADEARLLLGIKLFEAHRLSLGHAATLAGMTKAEFMESLGQHGIPVIDYPPADLENELKL